MCYLHESWIPHSHPPPILSLTGPLLPPPPHPLPHWDPFKPLVPVLLFATCMSRRYHNPPPFTHSRLVNNEPLVTPPPPPPPPIILNVSGLGWISQVHHPFLLNSKRLSLPLLGLLFNTLASFPMLFKY